jgi:hypothetical protein
MKLLLVALFVAAVAAAGDVVEEEETVVVELGASSEEVARALEAAFATGTPDPIYALKAYLRSSLASAAKPKPGEEYRRLPCQPKRSVSVARFLAVGADGFWVRPLPPLTPAYSLTYSVLMLPGAAWRMLHVFGDSHALYSNTTHFKLACSSAVAGEQELVQAVAGRHTLVGSWVGIATVVDADRLVLVVDALEEVSFYCKPRFPVSGLFIGATAAQSEAMGTRALFANVRHHNYNVQGQDPLVEPVALQLPASVDMTRHFAETEEEEEVEELLQQALESNDLNATRELMEQRAGRGSYAAMSVMGALESLAWEHNATRALVWHLLAVAAAPDQTGGPFYSCAALGRATQLLAFSVRLHYTRLAAQAAFEELSHEGFRAVDYVPVEEAEEEELQAGQETEKDEVMESLRYSSEGGDLESTLRVCLFFFPLVVLTCWCCCRWLTRTITGCATCQWTWIGRVTCTSRRQRRATSEHKFRWPRCTCWDSAAPTTKRF